VAGIRDAIIALLGVSAYEKPANSQDEDDKVDRILSRHAGNLARTTAQQTRFYHVDIEDAIRAADCGNLRPAAKLCAAMRRDGVISGLLSTCTDGLVRLPKVFSGDPEQVTELKPANDTRSVFDEMFPSAELALLAADGILLGVGVAELVPVVGRDYPVMVRQDPENLRYKWEENRWYFMTAEGEVPITPGDGRWILHLPGGRVAPWRNGKWVSIAPAWIDKTHAKGYRGNWESKLANPARVATSPSGATEEQSDSWFEKVMAWGVNTVFGMKPGYDVKLLESNGRGYESFSKTIGDSNDEFVIALAGQKVTTDGGVGFANADIHKSIRADIIKAIADALAHTVNTQGIPPWIVVRWGVAALGTRAIVVWDVTPPKDKTQEAAANAALANAVSALIDKLEARLAKVGLELDLVAIVNGAGVPVKKIAPPAPEQQSTTPAPMQEAA
jgi:hypothetical protein